MNEFKQARAKVDMLEAAVHAARSKAFDAIRYDEQYFTIAEGEECRWYNDEWLDAHINEAGKAAMAFADDFVQVLVEML